MFPKELGGVFVFVDGYGKRHSICKACVDHLVSVGKIYRGHFDLESFCAEPENQELLLQYLAHIKREITKVGETLPPAPATSDPEE